MGTQKVGLSFVQGFVLGFGFLSGLWIHVGVNPESEIASEDVLRITLLIRLIRAGRRVTNLMFCWITFR